MKIKESYIVFSSDKLYYTGNYKCLWSEMMAHAMKFDSYFSAFGIEIMWGDCDIVKVITFN